MAGVMRGIKEGKGQCTALTKKTPTDKKKKAVVIGRKGERGGVAECEGQTIRCERSHRAKWKTGY